MLSSLGGDRQMAALYAEDSAPNQLVTVYEGGDSVH